MIEIRLDSQAVKDNRFAYRAKASNFVIILILRGVRKERIVIYIR
jgi:hypothetical protein